MADQVWRSCEFDLSARNASDPNVVPAVLSTDAPVAMQMSGKRVLEILDHSEGAVDLSRFPLPLVENHDNSLTALAVAESPTLSDGKLRANIRFGAQARGVELLKDILSGVVRSLSISYDRVNTVRENDTAVRTVKWVPMHVSPVSTPADAGAGFFRQAQSEPTEKGAVMPDEIKPVAAAAVDINAVRAEAKDIATVARSLKLNADDFVGMSKADASGAMLAAVAAREAIAKPEPAAAAVSTMNYDVVDKQVAAITNAIGARAGVLKVDDKNPYAGRKLIDIAKRYAGALGIRASADWTDKDSANFFLGARDQVPGMRDAANITSGNFTGFVMLDAITKIVAKGFEMVPKGLTSASGAVIYDTQTVPDFKSYRIGGLSTANLIETAENTAFPELVKNEAVYSDTAKMWGGTLSLSLQALISDDTGAFDRSLRQAPVIAQKTIEKRLIQKLLMGTSSSTATSTWTSNTTSGCTPVFTTGDTIAAARANIGKANAALMVKTGLDGNPTGNMLRFYLAGPTSGIFLSSLLNQAPGQVTANPLAAAIGELVISPWLENSGLTGNSTTTYYVLADPMLVTTLLLTKVMGYENIQVQEYDAGAVGARKWKLWLPFEADLFFGANPAGTNVIPGAQQATT